MRALVFQHIDVEHPGFLRELMKAEDCGWDAVELDAGEPIPANLDEYDVLLVMGGPMDVWDEGKLPWLTAEKNAIAHWVLDRKAPFLGICLGHQLLAEITGGEVGLMSRPEVGVCELSMTEAGRHDPLFEGIPPSFVGLQWHGAEVKRLPSDAVVLATNASCAIQAFRFGECAFGFQFHVEATDRTVTEWGAVPAYRQSLASVAGPDGLQDLETAVGRSLASFNSLARQIYRNFRGEMQRHRAVAGGGMRQTAVAV
jgi:GMP synthase-like glutamine amidotransferase